MAKSFLRKPAIFCFHKLQILFNFLGNSCPGGSYTYVNNWLKEQGKEPITYPSGLIKSLFSNSKKVCQTYLISETKTT